MSQDTLRAIRLAVRAFASDRNDVALSRVLTMVAEEINSALEDRSGTTSFQEIFIQQVERAADDLIGIFDSEPDVLPCVRGKEHWE